MMKQTILTLACLLAMVAPSFAQNFAGDKIIGTYWVEQDGDKSKVRFSKTGANTYKAQIIWIEKAKDEKGNLRTDMKRNEKHPPVRSSWWRKSPTKTGNGRTERYTTLPEANHSPSTFGSATPRHSA